MKIINILLLLCMSITGFAQTFLHGDVTIKKGAIWWFVAKDPEDGITGLSLKAVIAPDELPD